MTGTPALRARPYEPPDLEAVVALARAGVEASPVGKGYAHPGDIVWQQYGPRATEPHTDDARVWLDTSGLAAHATFEQPGHLEFLLHPEADTPALVASVVEWAEQRQRSNEASGPLTTPVLTSDAPRIEALRALGFEAGTPAGTQFVWHLDHPIPAVLLPTRAVVRHATDADIEARALLHRQAWKVWGESSETAENYARLRTARLYDERLDVVYEWKDKLLSYCVCWADPQTGTAVFEPVGTRRDYAGNGFARSVMAEALYRLRAMGIHTAYIGTAAINTRALDLYSRFGFTEVDHLITYTRG
jgi:ribosomal protein S18 acetylase RimI-like enzyme